VLKRSRTLVSGDFRVAVARRPLGRSLRVGVFIPPPPPEGSSTSIHYGGIGRMPADAHRLLTTHLAGIRDHEVIINLNFRRAHIMNGSVFVDDICLSDLDLFFWYCEVDRGPGSFDLEVLKALSSTTKVVVNPQAFEIGLDKHASHSVLRRAGVRVPETVLFDVGSLETVRPILRCWGRALIKPRRGGFGKGVALVDTYAALRDMVEYTWSIAGRSCDGAFLLERYYENDLENWVSTTFIGRALAYGYRKRPSKIVEMGPGAYKVYDADEIGGDVELADLTPAQQGEAWKAYRALGLEVAGFDIIHTVEGPMIVDENTFPGYYSSIFTQTGRDPGSQFAELIDDEIAKFLAPDQRRRD
jgi:ribosomal protein S6--L-glutamate ligase